MKSYEREVYKMVGDFYYIRMQIVYMKYCLKQCLKYNHEGFYREFLSRSIALNNYVKSLNDLKLTKFVSKVEANILNKYINKLNER
jgi:hypothetical protein